MNKPEFIFECPRMGTKATSFDMCLKKYKLANLTNGAIAPGKNSRDLYCVGCEHGREIYEREKGVKLTESEQPKTKICADATCHMAGIPQPVEGFSKNKSICKTCQGRRIQAGIKNKTGPKPKTTTDTGLEIAINFEGHEDILQKIEDQAKIEVRNIDQQILWQLIKSLQRSKEV